MASIRKISGIAIVLLITTVGSYSIYEGSSPNNVHDQLKNWDKLAILNTSELASENTKDYNDWKAILNKDDLKEERNLFAPEITKQTDEKLQIKALQSKCQETLKITSRSPKFKSEVEKAKKFCIKNK